MSTEIFDRQLFALTTIIITETKANSHLYTGTASGFYYTEITPTDPEAKGPQWNRIDGQWLITNRHVLFPIIDGKECVVDKLLFCLREQVNDQINWIPITLNREEIIQHTKLHTDVKVDVVAIDVSQYIKDKLLESTNTGRHIIIPGALTNRNLPDNQPIVVEVTTDVIVASYPKGFYDEVNKFPIVKSGIVASGWGLHFKGKPMFEIDAQLFPGSSGGMVISKPTNTTMIDGKMYQSSTKQYVFLGVYSGEYCWDDMEQKADGSISIRKRSYGLGNVWYSYLIPEIIYSGVAISERKL